MIPAEHVKIEKHPDLVKDTKSGAVINIDKNKYLEHKKIMTIAKRNQAEKTAMAGSIVHMQSELNNLKDDVSAIKQMLTELLDRK